VFSATGQVVKVEAGLLLLPLIVSLCYHEDCAFAFAVTIVIALAIGFCLTAVFRNGKRDIYIREGFLIVALDWVLLSLIGALPFVLSGEVPSYVDALFETVSGLTTTGASILSDVEAMSHGLLFWRSFTHWIGGMGILVFVVMFSSQSEDRSMNILRAEMPGPKIDKLVPRTRDTARILYLIYLVMTVTEVILLLCGGMPLFDSLVHTFGTAGTGGFGIHPESIGYYSPYLQWVISVFMLLFGVNFNVYFLLLLRRCGDILRSTELRAYVAIVLISAAVICCDIRPLYHSLSETVRQAVFQVSSIITTTGYATTDFNLWPGLSRSILLLLMFVGGCAGSTAGGLKVSRVVLLMRIIRRGLRRAVHPREVGVIRMEGAPVDDETARSTAIYFALYMLLVLSLFLSLSFEPFDMETNFSAAVSCFNNVGPGFSLVGPMGGYGGYRPVSKLLLALAMLMGRLEIFPIVLLFSPASWRRR
jgi:trk system potassium uptake protein TrkH